MLKAESGYNEAAWQAEISRSYPLKSEIHQSIERSSGQGHLQKCKPQIDILLVDATGNVDIVEIKQPFGKCIVTNNQYRDNFIPLRELSGPVMQVEKHVFYLNSGAEMARPDLPKNTNRNSQMIFLSRSRILAASS